MSQHLPTQAGATVAPDGTWNYPYAGGAGAGEPTYALPARRTRDPRQATMAAVITFACLVLGLWAVLSFLGSMSTTLSSVASGSKSLQAQLTTANAGLAKLDTKTGSLTQMEGDTDALAKALTTIDTDMGTMVTDVGTIGTGMAAMRGSLGQLDEQVGGINQINAEMAPKLATINTQLADEAAQVKAMRTDVVATKKVLTEVPKRLNVTNNRLTWINSTINYFGCAGLVNQLHIRMSIIGIPNGSADISATITPKGAWGRNVDGTPCL
ncbi:MAG: hypothetical protein JWN72_2455 [Thermoleophilia bacterium]|nr:hypothetical protein [Thermoleophilia bacterium]